MKITFHKHSDGSNNFPQVVEMTCARRILFEAGLGAVRSIGESGDRLNVYAHRDTSSLYVKRTAAAGQLGSLVVDEGMYSDCMVIEDDGVGTDPSNMPWMELVDFVDLMRILTKVADPTWHPEPSPYIGGGRTQHHYAVQYVKKLVEVKKLLGLEFAWV